MQLLFKKGYLNLVQIRILLRGNIQSLDQLKSHNNKSQGRLSKKQRDAIKKKVAREAKQDKTHTSSSLISHGSKDDCSPKFKG